MQPCSVQSLRGRIVNVKQTVRNSSFWQEQGTTTVDCDVVIQFPRAVADTTVRWLHQKISNCEYNVSLQICSSSTTKSTYMLCTTSIDSVLRAAENVNFKKRLKKEFGGQLKEFTIEDLNHFEGADTSDILGFFNRQERQYLALYILNNIRLDKDEEIQNCVLVNGQAIVPRLLTKKIIKQIYCLHSQDDLTYLRKDWAFGFTAKQPLNIIKDYFGVHISMYFSFLGHYTTSLIIPALLGVVIWLNSGYDQAKDDVYFVIFALFNVVWSTIYLELWKRKEAEYAFRWGTLDRQDDLIEEPRPLYKGDLRISAVTGRLEPHYPKWRRNLFFYAVSIPIMILCHLVIVLVCFNFFTFYDYINDGIKRGSISFIFKPIPNFTLAIAVMVMDKVYQQIATWLNDKENYRNEEEYKNQLITKLMVFQSANSFLSLFYTAFYLQDFDRLKGQLTMLFIVRQILGNMKESLVSFFIAKVKQYNGAKGTENIFSASRAKFTPESADESPSVDKSQTAPNKLNQYEAEGLLPKYDGTFEDYLEMVIQFGYVTWFSSVFPLAGLFALLNNIVEIRSDAFKICMSFQRPFGEFVRDIGAWKTVLEVMSIGAIIVNTALIGMSGPMQRMFPDLSSTQRLLLIVILEHVVIALKFAIRMAISDIPEWVSIELAKLEFHRREALKLKTQDCLFALRKAEVLETHPLSSTQDSLIRDAPHNKETSIATCQSAVKNPHESNSGLHISANQNVDCLQDSTDEQEN